ncbi:MAG: hypothetical protein ACE5KA_01970 [Nitrososphaerales archaeon]
MQYHEASLTGQERARRSQHKLFEYSGFAFLTKTVKQVEDGFEPVGEEELAAMEDNGDGTMLVIICDAEGFAKAQTKPLPEEQAKKIFEKMLKDGFMEFKGETKAVK